MANQVLGGGLSSRLFQEIREKRGLAYSVWSSPSPSSDGGQFTAYAGTAPEQAATVLELLDGEVGRLLDGGITEDERGHRRRLPDRVAGAGPGGHRQPPRSPRRAR